MSDFAKNIKRRRLELGLSQEQLAEKLAVTRQTVSNWERSVSFPDLQMLGRIAAALGTDAAELIYPGRRRAAEAGIGALYVLAAVLLYFLLLFVGGGVFLNVCNPLFIFENDIDAFIIWGMILLAGFIAASQRRE